MPPNAVDIPVGPDPESGVTIPKLENRPPPRVPQPEANYKLQIFQSALTLLAHILIGAIVGICLWFAFRNGVPLNTTMLHIVLCVIGYQLLMAEGILALSSNNDWSSKLRFVDKRRAHWILQLVGSGLAIAGSIIMSLSKTVNFDTEHGVAALVAMVFTGASFINGLTSLYAYELRRLIPGNLSKITHIVFGAVGFVAASVSLCYGFEKNSFRGWTSDELVIASIVATSLFTAIIVINPGITFLNKSKAIVYKK